MLTQNIHLVFPCISPGSRINRKKTASLQPAISTMTLAFDLFHDPYHFTNAHSLPQNLPSITAPTGLPGPAFPANYDPWGIALTLSPAQYGAPVNFHHGDESHGRGHDMHPPDASSLLYGSYAPPPENEQLSPSTIVRRDTYMPVLGNPCNPVSPSELGPDSQARSAVPSDPLQSTAPPRRPTCSKRVLKRKRNRRVSPEVNPDPHITTQLQATDHCLPSSTTTATPKSPRVLRGFVGRGGSSSRIAPPPVPSLQPGNHQMSSPTSSGIHQQHQQQPQPGYPTVPIGSMDERYPKRRRVGDGQSPSGPSVAPQQQQIAGYPVQQYQSSTQTHWYGSGAQPTNASISQLSQPPYGYPSTSAGLSCSQYARPTHVPTRNTSMYVAPTPTAPAQWASGCSTQGQEPYSYHSGPVACPQLMQMQPHQQPPYISPTPATLAGTFPLADDPSSYAPPYLALANLTASNETHNSGAAPGGSYASLGGTMGGPTSLHQQIGPTRSNGNKRRLVPKPYQRPTPAARKTRPVVYEGNLVRLQQRCRRQGADEGAIVLLGKVFTNEVSLEALTRPPTDAEVETNEFGVETGRVYIAFLETISEEEGVGTYYVCRLCRSEQIWRQHKDVLRHLRRDHFGLADVCHQWYVSGRSLTLLILIIKYVSR